MPNNVDEQTCENRRQHCTAAMGTAVQRIENAQTRFIEKMGDRVTEMVEAHTITDQRSKSNQHRLNWVWKVLAGVIVAAIAMLVKMIVGVL